jgi:hypothetical protein
MFLLKKLIFKMMELGLGLRTCFSLDTKDPIFVNFKLTAEEVISVKNVLPSGFELQPIRFLSSDDSPDFWVSYNLYELKYPNPQLASIKKARLEINTFVEDPTGRKGVFVFSDSPFVSRESKRSLLGSICDFAEWLVTKIYGCGHLVDLKFSLSEELSVIFQSQGQSLKIQGKTPESVDSEDFKLSSDYCLYNDISFFNHGKTCDYVNVNSSFHQAKFASLGIENCEALCEGPFFNRQPDVILVHRGNISYLVNALNLVPRNERPHV